jgi:predicted aspartyl protease
MPCLIDTGAEYTLISAGELQAWSGQLQALDKSKLSDPVLQTTKEPVYATTVEIHGLDPVDTMVICSPRTERHAMLIGRNLLKHYRLIYDPTKPEFFLGQP